jgi:hypothetical protein
MDVLPSQSGPHRPALDGLGTADHLAQAELEFRREDAARKGVDPVTPCHGQETANSVRIKRLHGPGGELQRGKVCGIRWTASIDY